MNTFGLNSVVASCVALMDTLVAIWCGLLLWRDWGGIAWAREELVVLEGGCSFALADMWSVIIDLWPRPLCSVAEDALGHSGSATPTEPSDV